MIHKINAAFLIVVSSVLLRGVNPTPPSCSQPDTQAAATSIESRMMADINHEWTVVLDCFTNHVVVNVSGSLYSTVFSYDTRQTSNQMELHSHPLSTQPSIEDIQNLYKMNVLEFRLIGYDAKSKTWSRCTFAKPSFDSTWPQIDQTEYTKLWAEVHRTYYKAQGSSLYRWQLAHAAMWQRWTSENGINRNCTTLDEG